ncbi:glutaredoxin family protein [Deinococcus alpinitundrae]|uniref:glutaredoxin family protein n=1 Tax=Deinococcus alpinitundrae TaxID=468913 RepID=UPI00192A2ECB|nr:glutaredoxin family protein [Deinococcus alpinitundrae]
MTTSSTPITMYTTSWCPDCKAAKRALDSKGLAYTEINIEEVEDAAEAVMRVNGGKRSVPTLVYGDTAASLSGFSIVKMNAFLSQAGLA